MTNNKKKGSQFEQKFCRMLADAGFWAHNLADRKNGQPFDVVASKNDLFFAFDCKTCADGKFNLSRIEENQALAMQKLMKCGSYYNYFALQDEDETVYIASYYALMLMERERSCIYLDEFQLFESWLAEWN